MSFRRFYESNYSKFRNPLLIIMAIVGLYHMPFFNNFLGFLDYELFGPFTFGSVFGGIVAFLALSIYKDWFG